MNRENLLSGETLADKTLREHATAEIRRIDAAIDRLKSERFQHTLTLAGLEDKRREGKYATEAQPTTLGGR